MNKKSKQQIIIEEILMLLEKNRKGLRDSELRKKYHQNITLVQILLGVVYLFYKN